MNDRELLELAAKAAGHEYAKHGGYIVVDGIPGNWNPLTADCDALRLAVKLSLDVTHWGGSVNVNKPGKGWVHAVEHWGPIGDQLAATRRAIVRAAAELGKAMP